MHHRFSEDDLARLLGLATRMADTHGCSSAEAVERIERAMQAVPATRSVGAYAEGLRRARARRNELLGARLMRDPAWDMLLDLLAAEHVGREMTVKALCLGAGVPTTTALRHLDLLQRYGFVTRQAHPHDHRRILVRLARERVGRVEAVVAMIRDL